MFAPISAVFALLFFASTLPNGIRLNELPAEGDTVEILAGYTAGGLTGFANTAGATSLLHDAYTVGAKVEVVNDLDRTAFRITAPKWALETLSARIPGLFKEKGDEGADPSSPDFRDRVEDEIRNALLGPITKPAAYATDDAFVLISAPLPNGLREALAEIPKRGAATKPEEAAARLPAERTFRFKSDLPAGAVIFASPISGVHYKQWYLMLLVDRVIRHVVPLKLQTALPLTVRPYYYRVELAVAAGQFPEPSEENLLQEMQRLQFTQANARDLNAARQEALAYLDSKSVREWFASHDLLAQREEGKQWIQSMSADDVRTAARDLLIMNRVIASWYPKPKQTAVTSEPLTPVRTVFDRPGRSQTAPTVRAPAQAGVKPFPTHTDKPTSTLAPERLASGVFLATSTSTAVYVSSGPMTRFDRDLTPDDLKSFQQYRPDRILVLVPAASVAAARQLWNTFKGSSSGETGVSRGKVSSGDLPALFVLKTILDLKILAADLSHDVSVRIDAARGSDLQIEGPDDKRAQVLDWIKTLANTPPDDTYFAWAREVAVHQFDNAGADLEALTWERDAQGTVQGIETVSSKHVQDVARIYF